MLVNELARIVEAPLDMRQITAFARQAIGIALGADGQHDPFCFDRLAINQINREPTLQASDRLGLGPQSNLDSQVAGSVRPGRQRRFAAFRRKRDVRSKYELGGRRHDVLAALIVENRVSQVLGFPRGAGGRDQSWPRARRRSSRPDPIQ